MMEAGERRGALFIKINNDYEICPKKVCDAIMEDVHLNNLSSCRFGLRLIPISIGFKMDMEKFK
jgi:hypothetical protein